MKVNLDTISELLLLSHYLRSDAVYLRNYLFMLSIMRTLQEAQKQLQTITRFDSLTQLANRIQFDEDLNREVARAKRYKRKIALFYIDIDYFNKINDKFGHSVGDLLLKQVTCRLRLAIRTEDFIARIAGDKFAVILTEIDNTHEAGIVAHRIVESLGKSFNIDNQTVVVSASVGISIYPEAGSDLGTLNKSADIALYSAKSLGRSNYQFFTADLHEKHARKLELEAELHFALERKEFFLVYQPRIDLRTKKMVGMEALIRWQHPRRGVVPPDEFIHLAEESGLIIPIGQWVLDTACQQFAEWRKMNNKFEVVLAINVSPKQFQRKDLVLSVMRALEESNIPSQFLELEITESAVTGYIGRIESALFQLRNIGVSFSIDDFGTGYSSLTRLKQLPISAIKIDRSFVNDLGDDASDDAIVRSTLELAKGMGINAVAEGVENSAQEDFLIKNRCPQAQGYYYSMPLTVDEMVDFIKSNFNTTA